MIIFYCFIAFFFTNLIAFSVCAYDKRMARDRKWRVSEGSLWFVSALFGSVGMYAAMRIFHHKTRHKSFMIGVPILIVIQTLCVAVVLYRYFSALSA